MLVTVDWLKLVQRNVPQWMRRKRMVVWLMVCVSAVRDLHAAFIGYRERSLYSLRITGQTISLEMALNDRFDFLNRDIWIETAVDVNQFYLRNRVELALPTYCYNRYNPSHPYAVGEYAVHAGRRWKALLASPSQEPGIDMEQWSDEGPRLFLKNQEEGQSTNDFIIWVPVSLVYDESELRALVAIYKLAGKTYTIQTY